MAVALNHLRRYRGGFQSQARAHLFFEFRREVCKGSDRARELAHAQVFGGGLETRDVALCLRIPVGNLEAKGDRFRVDAVSPPNHRRIFELPRAPFEHLGQTLQIAGYQR